MENLGSEKNCRGFSLCPCLLVTTTFRLFWRTSCDTLWRRVDGQWNHEQVKKLAMAVQQFSERNCYDIVWCLKVQADGITTGPFPKEEDEFVLGLVKVYGQKWWPLNMAVSIPECTVKKCQESPNTNNEERMVDEIRNLINTHRVYRNIWMKLTKSLPTRAEGAIKKQTSTCPGKKKLGPFSASTLVSQFRGLSLVGHRNRPAGLVSKFRSLSLVGHPNRPAAKTGVLGGVKVNEISEGTSQVHKKLEFSKVLPRRNGYAVKKVVAFKVGNRECSRPSRDPISRIRKREAAIRISGSINHEPVSIPKLQSATKVNLTSQDDTQQGWIETFDVDWDKFIFTDCPPIGHPMYEVWYDSFKEHVISEMSPENVRAENPVSFDWNKFTNWPPIGHPMNEVWSNAYGPFQGTRHLKCCPRMCVRNII